MRDREAVGVRCDRSAVDVKRDRRAVDVQNTGEADPEDD
jgi:hypothetical protein